MPPKAAPAPIVPEEKGFNINISVIQTDFQDGSEPFSACQNCRIKIISEWLDCCGTTGLFGAPESDLLWKDILNTNEEGLNSDGSRETKKRVSIFKKSFDPFFVDKDPQREKLSKFNIKPGIYFVVLIDLVEDSTYKQIPVKFSYVDCSSFLIKAGSKKSSLSISDSVEIQISVEIDKPIMTYADALTLEPLVLDFNRCYFPSIQPCLQ